ncbi:MAG TPA: hypothetical protein VFJ74_12915 [Gemmatimonadaceae bacterium]|nr:hypothetical protein [Gemmatimonadaceae bacterium]
MHGFWIFWIVALVFWSTTVRRRWAWRRWEMMGPPMWYRGRWAAYDGAWHRAPRGARHAATPARREPMTEDEASHVEALETRIAELEQRLDFTERLLAGRSEKEQR